MDQNQKMSFSFISILENTVKEYINRYLEKSCFINEKPVDREAIESILEPIIGAVLKNYTREDGNPATKEDLPNLYDLIYVDYIRSLDNNTDMKHTFTYIEESKKEDYLKRLNLDKLYSLIVLTIMQELQKEKEVPIFDMVK
jgi:hypothetical protein